MVVAMVVKSNYGVYRRYCVYILSEAEGVRFQVSVFSAAAGLANSRSNRKKETLKKRISNIGQGIINVEGMCSIDFIKMTERSDSILRHSTFEIPCSAVRFI
jgi:hypothetical protein